MYSKEAVVRIRSFNLSTILQGGKENRKSSMYQIIKADCIATDTPHSSLQRPYLLFFVIKLAPTQTCSHHRNLEKFRLAAYIGKRNIQLLCFSQDYYLT